MARFKPVLGPGLGFEPESIDGRVTNDGILRLRGTTAVHGTGHSGRSYAFLNAHEPADAPGKLVGVVLDDVIGFNETRTVVIGRVRAKVAGSPDDGSWFTNDPLTATLEGDMRPALSGEMVYARALEDGLPGEYRYVDFNGDPGFGLLP